MGQAKRRGTYEERKASAIADNEKAARLLREQEEAWWNSLTSEEQDRVAKNRVKRAKTLAMLTGMTAAAQGGPRLSKLPNINLQPGNWKNMVE